nr:RNA polymerase II subunit [Drosophila melanogaster]
MLRVNQQSYRCLTQTQYDTQNTIPFTRTYCKHTLSGCLLPTGPPYVISSWPSVPATNSDCLPSLLFGLSRFSSSFFSLPGRIPCLLHEVKSVTTQQKKQKQKKGGTKKNRTHTPKARLHFGLVATSIADDQDEHPHGLEGAVAPGEARTVRHFVP